MNLRDYPEIDLDTMFEALAETKDDGWELKPFGPDRKVVRCKSRFGTQCPITQVILHQDSTQFVNTSFPKGSLESFLCRSLSLNEEQVVDDIVWSADNNVADYRQRLLDVLGLTTA